MGPKNSGCSRSRASSSGNSHRLTGSFWKPVDNIVMIVSASVSSARTIFAGCDCMLSPPVDRVLIAGHAGTAAAVRAGAVAWVALWGRVARWPGGAAVSGGPARRVLTGQLTGNTIAWPVWPLAARAPATIAEPLPATATDWSPPPRSSSETGCGSVSVPVSFQVPALVLVATKTSPDSKAVPAVAVGAPNAMVAPSADMPMLAPAAKAALVLFLGGSTSLAWVKVPPDLVNTNTSPLRSLMPVWPAATMVPLLETATESPPPGSCAVCVQALAP